METRTRELDGDRPSGAAGRARHNGHFHRLGHIALSIPPRAPWANIAPVRELRPGVWHWQSPHPDWDEEQWWPALVSSYAIELGDDFVLFDPLAVPDELRDARPPSS